MRFPNFVGGTYQSDSFSADAQRTLNLYPELVESRSGKNSYRFHGRPGLVELAELPTSPVRCLWAGDERLFAVAGSKLYEVFSDGTYDERGDVGDDASHSPAQIHTNGNQLLIISAGEAFLDNGVSLASAPVPEDPFALPDTPAEEVGTASCAAMLDGYFIAAKPSSKTFFYSTNLDGSEWDDLDRQVKAAYPDNIAQMMTSHSELWIFGTQTTEVFRNEGGDDVFRRDPGAFIHQGIVAPASACRFDQGLAWLGGDTSGKCIAWRTVGFSPKRISNHAIEAAWSGYSTVSDAVGFSFVWKGHTFLVFNFLTANKTWVYDLNTNLWHEWGSGANKFRGRCHAFTFSKHLVGDHTTGQIFELSGSTYRDDGAATTYQRACPYIAEERKNISYKGGVQLEAENTSPANYSLDWSTDGGQTWIDAIPAEVDLWWRRLGGGRDRVFRFTSTANAKQAWTDAYIYPKVGRH